MIRLPEFLMGRHIEFPLTLDLALNAATLLAGVNYLRGVYGKPLSVSSGYRPGHYNKSAGGAKLSAHQTCEAIDIRDPDGKFGEWCLANIHYLEHANLYLENPAKTVTSSGVRWIHLQTRQPRSGNRVFNP